MTDANGRKVECLLALAPWERRRSGTRTTSRPKKKRVGPLNLRKERAKIAEFVTKAARRFRMEVGADVERLDVAVGADDGTLAVSFDVDDAEPGRVISRWSSEELLRPGGPM